MLKLHPEILSHKGRPQFAVLPYAEFLAVQRQLEDLEDLLTLRRAKAKEKKAPTTPLVEVARQLGVELAASPKPKRGPATIAAPVRKKAKAS